MGIVACVRYLIPILFTGEKLNRRIISIFDYVSASAIRERFFVFNDDGSYYRVVPLVFFGVFSDGFFVVVGVPVEKLLIFDCLEKVGEFCCSDSPATGVDFQLELISIWFPVVFR